MKKYAFPLIMWLLFEAIAITLWLALDNLFYLFNFSYIGLCLAFGIAFYIKKVKYARHMVQLGLWGCICWYTSADSSPGKICRSRASGIICF